MNRYLVIYYNGKGNREKVFYNKDMAVKFLSECEDSQATIWQELQLD